MKLGDGNFTDLKGIYDKKGQCSLASIIDGITKLSYDETSETLYFRGESREHDFLTPSLYTVKELALNGSEEYYQRLISVLGRDDYSYSTSLVRLMSELQHYGAKTRWLDVSSSLAAIFFAVEKHVRIDDDRPGEPGYIYIFKVPKCEEKYDTGHTIAIKTALNLIPQEEINDFLDACSNIKKRIMDNLSSIKANTARKNLQLSFDEYYKRVVTHLTIQELPDFDEQFKGKGGGGKSILQKTLHISFLPGGGGVKSLELESIERFMDLLNQRARVHETLKYPFAIFEDLSRAHHCRLSMCTDRIRQQQGSFIFPAYVNTTGKDSNQIAEEISDSFQKYLYNDGKGKYIRIRIPVESKPQIRKQLDSIGFHEGFLYADIKNQSDAILRELRNSHKS